MQQRFWEKKHSDIIPPNIPKGICKMSFMQVVDIFGVVGF